MKLNDVYSRPLKEVLEQDCDVVEQKIHTDENGEVQAIEVKYKPKEKLDAKEDKRFPGEKRNVNDPWYR